MMRWLNPVWPLAVLVIGHGLPADPPTVSTVTFKVVERLGRVSQYPYQVKTLIESLSKRDYISHCSQATCRDLPTGSYRYSLAELVLGGELDGEASLTQRDQVVVRVRNEDIHSKVLMRETVVRGAVRNRPSSGGPLRARLMSVYSVGSVEIPVDNYGHFEFRGAPPGELLLLIFNNTGLLGFQPVEAIGVTAVVNVELKALPADWQRRR